LSVCPRCGTEVNNQIKTWSMIGRPNKSGEQFKLTLGFFMCPECEKRFLKVLGKKKEEGNLKGAVEEIKGIERGLAQIMGDLKKKIEKLKNERAELLEEIEELKRTGETKASTLEEEISSLREEVESLKKMLVDDK
jgi:DNA repair exonuclease SbcCD ATPase subunit